MFPLSGDRLIWVEKEIYKTQPEIVVVKRELSLKEKLTWNCVGQVLVWSVGLSPLS